MNYEFGTPKVVELSRDDWDEFGTSLKLSKGAKKKVWRPALLRKSSADLTLPTADGELPNFHIELSNQRMPGAFEYLTVHIIVPPVAILTSRQLYQVLPYGLRNDPSGTSCLRRQRHCSLQN